jgi:hypothetical protein
MKCKSVDLRLDRRSTFLSATAFIGKPEAIQEQKSMLYHPRIAHAPIKSPTKIRMEMRELLAALRNGKAL